MHIKAAATTAGILAMLALAVFWNPASRSDDGEKTGSPAFVGSKAGGQRTGRPGPAHDVTPWPDSGPRGEASGHRAYAHPLLTYLEKLDIAEDYDLAKVFNRYQQYADALEPEERNRLLVAVARWYSRNHPGGAHDFMSRLGTSVGEMRFGAEFVDRLFLQDRSAALDWLEHVPESVVAAHLHEQLARTWARHDLEGALEWAGRLPGTGFRADALQGVAFSWTQQDAEAALKWVSSLEQVELQNRILAKMVKVFATEKPSVAARWALELPDSRDVAAALQFAVHQWVMDDFGPAMEWALALPEQELQAAALRAAAGAWGQMASKDAADWFAEWPDPELRAGSLGFIMADWSEHDPSAAVSWLEDAKEIGDPLRESLMGAVFARVAARDEFEARRLMDRLRSAELRTIAEAAVSDDHDLEAIDSDPALETPDAVQDTP